MGFIIRNKIYLRDVNDTALIFSYSKRRSEPLIIIRKSNLAYINKNPIYLKQLTAAGYAVAFAGALALVGLPINTAINGWHDSQGLLILSSGIIAGGLMALPENLHRSYDLYHGWTIIDK